MKEHPTAIWLHVDVLGEVLKAVFPYLEHAAGAVHSRLVSISHTALANILCLNQLVIWAVVLILAL